LPDKNKITISKHRPGQINPFSASDFGACALQTRLGKVATYNFKLHRYEKKKALDTIKDLPQEFDLEDLIEK